MMGRKEAMTDARPMEYCREELGEEHGYHRCDEPAEFILWGKLIKPEGLGPRCYDHAAQHVGHSALYPNSGWAVFDLRPVDPYWIALREEANRA